MKPVFQDQSFCLQICFTFFVTKYRLCLSFQDATKVNDIKSIERRTLFAKKVSLQIQEIQMNVWNAADI